ncbi:MAG: hypothetical protein ACP5P1_14530, partial [Acidimicrobiales bacterium]
MVLVAGALATAADQDAVLVDMIDRHVTPEKHQSRCGSAVRAAEVARRRVSGNTGSEDEALPILSQWSRSWEGLEGGDVR